MENEQLMMCRHSMAHVLAKAIKQWDNNAKLTIGPAINNGFYYDFDMKTISPENFSEIEKLMQKIINSNQPFVRKEVSKSEALELFKDNEYKVELI